MHQAKNDLELGGHVRGRLWEDINPAVDQHICRINDQQGQERDANKKQVIIVQILACIPGKNKNGKGEQNGAQLHQAVKEQETVETG